VQSTKECTHQASNRAILLTLLPTLTSFQNKTTGRMSQQNHNTKAHTELSQTLATTAHSKPRLLIPVQTVQSALAEPTAAKIVHAQDSISAGRGSTRIIAVLGVRWQCSYQPPNAHLIVGMQAIMPIVMQQY
jgi:hypothetical protein